MDEPVEGFFKRHVRLIAFLLLIALTAYGVYAASDELSSAAAGWRNKGPALAIALLCAFLDVALDVVLWMLVGTYFGLQVRDRTGVLIFGSMYAGQLLPVHLGRALRPDAIQAMGRGTLMNAAKAEVVGFFIAAIAAAAFLAGTVAYAMTQELGLPAAMGAAGAVTAFVATTVTVMFITDRASHLAIGKLPLGKLAFLEEFQVPNYWMRRRTFGLVVLAAVGWLLHGLGLYAVVHDLDGAENPLLWALFSGPASTCLGAGVGMPGGIGATEGFLGVALKSLTSVAGADMLLAVAAFRFNTFWVWLPFGWIALTLVNRIRNRG